METSLSVQNDAILKKAKWWFIAHFVLFLTYLLIAYIYNFFEVDESISGMTKPLGIIMTILFYVYTFNILAIIACVRLFKHNSSTIQRFTKLLLISSILPIIPIVIRCIIQYVFKIEFVGKMAAVGGIGIGVLELFIILIQGYVCCMSLATLWKNEIIRTNYKDIIIFSSIVVLLGSASFLDEAWSSIVFWIDNLDEYRYINNHFCSMFIPQLLPIVQIYCCLKLFKTPSAIPTEEKQDTLAYHYRPTKIELGYLVSILLFFGLIILSLTFV